jgi:hypothetical protein
MMGRMAMGLMLSGSVASCDLASEVMGVKLQAEGQGASVVSMVL